MVRGLERLKYVALSTAYASPDATAFSRGHTSGSARRLNSSSVRARLKLHGISTRTSGSYSAMRAQDTSTEYSPSRLSSSRPPARRIISGTQWPAVYGGASPPLADTPGRPPPPLAVRAARAVPPPQTPPPPTAPPATPPPAAP